MGENKKELREAAQASEEERKELMEGFREEQAQLSQELKALHKEIRESIGGEHPRSQKLMVKSLAAHPEPGVVQVSAAHRINPIYDLFAHTRRRVAYNAVFYKGLNWEISPTQIGKYAPIFECFSASKI